MRQMLKRRLKDAGLPDLFSPHSFRAAVVTDLLKQDGPLEDVQFLAGHSSPITTRLYDRRRRKVTRNIVARISIEGLTAVNHGDHQQEHALPPAREAVVCDD